MRKGLLLIWMGSVLCITGYNNITASAIEDSDLSWSIRYGLGILHKASNMEGCDDEGSEHKINKPWYASIELGKKLNYQFSLGISFDHLDSIRYKLLISDETESAPNANYNPINTMNHDIGINALFTTLYFIPSFRVMDDIQPYIALGAGVALIDSGDIVYNSLLFDDKTQSEYALSKKAYKGKKQTNFSWNIGFGVYYQLTDNIELELVQYKYHNFGKAYTRYDYSGELRQSKVKIHSINTGLKIQF